MIKSTITAAYMLGFCRMNYTGGPRLSPYGAVQALHMIGLPNGADHCLACERGATDAEQGRVVNFAGMTED